jgi:hypothetical protein
MSRYKNFINSDWLIAIYLGLIVLTPLWKVPGLPAIRLDDIWLLLASAVIFFNRPSLRVQRELMIPLVCVLAITLASLMSFLAAGYFLTTFFSVLSTIRLLFVIYIVSNVQITLPGLKRMTLVIILVGCINVGAALVYYYHIAPFDLILLKLYTSADGFEKYSAALLESGHLGRAGGTMANPNYLGFLLVLSILACVDRAFTSKIITKILSIGGILGFTYVIAFILQSRSALVVEVIMVAAYVVIYFIKRGNILGYTMLVVMVIAGLMLVVFGFAFTDMLPRRVAAIFQVTSIDDFLYQGELLGPRMNIWTYQIELISENAKSFLFGYLPYGGTTVSDNSFINTWYRAGFLGFISYIIMTISYLVVLMRRLRHVAPNGPLLAVRVMFIAMVMMSCLIDLTADTLYSAKWGVLCMTLLFVGMRRDAMISGIPQRVGFASKQSRPVT